MTSFFRKRIAHKVLSALLKKQDFKLASSPNIISTLVKVNRFKSFEAELVLPWRKIEQLCGHTVSTTPKELVRQLRNQGLPTAEGFTDIQFVSSSTDGLDSSTEIIFTVDRHIFSKIVLLDIFTNEDNLAKSSCFFEDIKKKNVVVQCSVPSVGEICGLSDLRTIIHTNYVANINKFVGHHVKKIAHVDDWGLKAATFMTGFKQFHGKEILEEKGVNHLLEIYKAVLKEYSNSSNFKMLSDKCYENMRQGDTNTVLEWQNLKQMCMNYYYSLYKRLGVHFDEFYFDSEHTEKSGVIFKQLSDAIFNEDGSRKNLELGDDTFLNKITDIDSTLYELNRHINAATKMKEKDSFDSMYYVSPSTQKDFLLSLFFMMKKLNYFWVDDLHHVNLTTISSFDSKRSKKLSIEAVLDKVKDGMITKLHEDMQMELNDSLEEMAEQLSLSSLIINDLKWRRNVDYEFTWKSIINFQKDAAASFQLCSAGLKGLLEDSEYIFQTDIDTSPLMEPEALNLIKHLARFDEMVFKSYTILEPCIIFQYLSSLWFFTDRATNVLKLDIKGSRLKVIKARLMLLSATLKILNKSLQILGVTPLEKVYSEENFFAQNTK